MCFSATASFAAASVLAVFGYKTLKCTTEKKEYLLALFPLIFASQQLVEGILWLYLSDRINAPPPYIFSYLFLFYADVMWPLLCPIAVFLVETKALRRRLMVPFILAGVACAGYLLYKITNGTIVTFILEANISYSLQNVTMIQHINMIYLGIVTGSFLLSSHKLLILFGLTIVLSFLITDHFAQETFISVWCFFAALLSLILFLYFWRKN